MIAVSWTPLIDLITPLPLVLALVALTVRDLNPKQKKATCIISICAVVFSLAMMLPSGTVAFIAAFVIGIIFGIIALVHRDRMLIIVTFSSVAVIVIIVILVLVFTVA